jgi:hypothetical protein
MRSRYWPGRGTARPGRTTVEVVGYAATNLRFHAESRQDRFTGLFNKVLAQSSDLGAPPVLSPATKPDLLGGTYLGQGGPGELRGHPRPAGSSAAAQDRRTQQDLWKLSERRTGVSFPLRSAG